MIYVGIIIHYLPESPRWLSRVGRHEEAETIVRALEQRVEAAIGRRLPDPVIAPEVALAVTAHRSPPSLAALGVVWRAPYLLRTVAMITGAFGTFSMFYVGVNYIPSLFIQQHIAMTSAFLFTLVIAGVQTPGKILTGLISELVGRKAIYLIFTIPAAIGAYEFGHTHDPYEMLGWASLFLFCAAGSAPSRCLSQRDYRCDQATMPALRVARERGSVTTLTIQVSRPDTRAVASMRLNMMDHAKHTIHAWLVSGRKPRREIVITRIDSPPDARKV